MTRRTHEKFTPLSADEIHQATRKLRAKGITVKVDPPLPYLARLVAPVLGRTAPKGEGYMTAIVREFLFGAVIKKTVILTYNHPTLSRPSWRDQIPAQRLHDHVPSVIATTRSWRDGRTEVI